MQWVIGLIHNDCVWWCVGKVAPTADVYKHKMMMVPEQPAEVGEEAMATPKKDETSPDQSTPVEKKEEDQQSTEQWDNG